VGSPDTGVCTVREHTCTSDPNSGKEPEPELKEPGTQSLKGFGVRIAIDDFGTGFSSLSTLASLPVDILKIDRSFVFGQASATPSVPMLEGILGLANKLSLAVIAEGIEEPEQLDLLATLGCRMGQGYLLARPATADVLEALLASGGLLQPGSTPQVGDVIGS
jgi:EAL domain-containing protein (putative c-di-GMP-specific phosphodiesterase class I)